MAKRKRGKSKHRHLNAPANTMRPAAITENLTTEFKTLADGLAAADAKLKGGEPEAALAIFAGLHEGFPDEPEPVFRAARLLKDQGRADEADRLLEKAQGRLAGNFGLMINRAWLAHERRDLAAAVDRWAEMREAFPDHPAGYAGGAGSLRDAGRFEEAEKLAASAIERFRDDPGVAMEYARSASARRDFVESISRWQKLVERFPDQAGAHLGLASAMRELGRLDEADDRLREAMERFPADAGPVIEFAWIAQIRRDWPEAARRWQDVASRFPDHHGAFLMAAGALRAQGQLEQADRILAEAVERFPRHSQLLTEYAKLAQEQEQWEQAARRWEKLRAAFPEEPEGYLGGAAALSALQRDEDADRLVADAAGRFPITADRLAEHAWAPYHRHQWEQAGRRFAGIRERFPDEPVGYHGGAETLLRQNRFVDAEELLAEGMRRMPQDPKLAHSHAVIPSYPGRRQWDAALERIDAVCKRFPDFAPGHVTAVRMLRECRRFEDAEAAARRAFECCAGSAEFGVEYARLARDRSDLGEALRRYQAVIEQFPDQVAGFVGLAEALTGLGRFDEAEAVLDRTMTAFPTQPEPFAAHADLAMRRNEAAEALRRWDEAVRRFPDNSQLAQRLFEARLTAAEIDPVAAAAERTEIVNGDDPGHLPPMRDLIGAFESLGGTPPGCEFGLLQRTFGAEPLGLLRWTEMDPEGLIAALEAEFEGVGLPENTELLTAGDDDLSDYGTRDRRFGMRMHTFVPIREVPADVMFVRTCRRLQFLRDKLIEDLKAGAKIFVYKTSTRNLTDREVDQLHQAMRRYGDNTLLYVRYADAAHPNGTVETVGPGLMIGYIDRFSMSAAGEQLGPATASWVPICQAAYRTWRSAQRPVPVARPLAEASA